MAARRHAALRALDRAALRRPPGRGWRRELGPARGPVLRAGGARQRPCGLCEGWQSITLPVLEQGVWRLEASRAPGRRRRLSGLRGRPPRQAASVDGLRASLEVVGPSRQALRAAAVECGGLRGGRTQRRRGGGEGEGRAGGRRRRRDPVVTPALGPMEDGGPHEVVRAAEHRLGRLLRPRVGAREGHLCSHPSHQRDWSAAKRKKAERRGRRQRRLERR
mmetsp:Transcript_10599/g.28141  ORF Transcript_10599/g.28141 Transcript_10599/m.28141 type:complete len:220 (-) Transcript_10599:498-1157(-)